MILDQRKRTQVQSRCQGDAVDAGIQGRGHAHLQRLFGRVHGELFHAVDVDLTAAHLAVHGALDMQAGGFGQMAQIELDIGFVVGLGHILVESLLGLDVLGFVAAVGHRFDHGIRDVAHAAQPGRLHRQVGRRNVHTHASNHDGHELLAAQVHAEVIQTFHNKLSGKQRQPTG